MGLNALGLAEAAAGNPRRPAQFGRAGRRLPRAYRCDRWRRRGVGVSRSGPRDVAGRGRRRSPQAGPADRPAAWRARRHQGYLRHRGLADGIRIEAVGRAHAAPRRGGGGAAAGGGRRDPRQDGDDRVRLFQSRARPAIRTTGITRRADRRSGSAGGRCRADGAGRHRFADQRLGDPARRFLRRGRVQADPRPHSAQRRAAAVAGARSCRRVRALGRAMRRCSRRYLRASTKRIRIRAPSPVRRSSKRRPASRHCRRASRSFARPPGSMPRR